jgi:hypothetical protein
MTTLDMIFSSMGIVNSSQQSHRKSHLGNDKISFDSMFIQYVKGCSNCYNIRRVLKIKHFRGHLYEPDQKEICNRLHMTSIQYPMNAAKAKLVKKLYTSNHLGTISKRAL